MLLSTRPVGLTGAISAVEEVEEERLVEATADTVKIEALAVSLREKEKANVRYSLAEERGKSVVVGEREDPISIPPLGFRPPRPVIITT